MKVSRCFKIYPDIQIMKVGSQPADHFFLSPSPPNPFPAPPVRPPQLQRCALPARGPGDLTAKHFFRTKQRWKQPVQTTLKLTGKKEGVDLYVFSLDFIWKSMFCSSIKWMLTG